jgi:hypothetical protein
MIDTELSVTEPQFCESSNSANPDPGGLGGCGLAGLEHSGADEQSTAPFDIQRIEDAVSHVSDDEGKILLYFLTIGILAGLPFWHVAHCSDQKLIDLRGFERNVSLDIGNTALLVNGKTNGSQIVTFKSSVRNFIDGICFQVVQQFFFTPVEEQPAHTGLARSVPVWEEAQLLALRFGRRAVVFSEKENWGNLLHRAHSRIQVDQPIKRPVIAVHQS